MEISCDILVVGGGIAGIAAAVKAAREGANTLLIEKNSFPGGIAIHAMHRYICGLYSSDLRAPINTLNGGIAEEICHELKNLSPGIEAIQMGNVYVYPFATKDLLKVLKNLIDKQTGLEIFYETELNSIQTKQDNIKKVITKGLKGELIIYPRAVIDCSGDGAAIRLSGAAYELSPANVRQLAGFCIKIKGIKNPPDMVFISVPYYVLHAVIEKKLPPYLKYIKFYPGDIDDEGFCLINLPFENNFEKAEEAKKLAVKIHDILVDSLVSFKDSYIDKLSSVIAEREGLRMVGQYMLTREDVLSARKFYDGVVKNAWPIELWNQDKGPVYQYVEAGDFYEIPLRCLKSINIKNLYGAGRCVSVSHEALGSTRVMGTCISLGEQAGLAAVKSLSGIGL
ncbi:MAG: FAD-dependent oxidoreductase [Desulfobacterium sp.]|nr:FAD-dependent oxidoreductase [Desulfobacterium sp.]MBU3950173.1 FAD-dependent oxidoreductase [Pseudomonadota bacterium]MBU4035295.1 FAD-dependent oxidoreductase [Pseudomonadota bacterium]